MLHLAKHSAKLLDVSATEFAWLFTGFLIFFFPLEQSYATPKLLFLGAYSFILLLSRRTIRQLGLDFWLVFLCWTWGVLRALIVGFNPFDALEVIALFPLAGLAFLTANPISTKNILSALHFAGIANACYLISQFFGHDFFLFEIDYRIGGFFGNSNQSAAFLVLCFSYTRFSKLQNYLSAGLFLLAIYMSGCRTAWLATCFGLLWQLRHCFTSVYLWLRRYPLALTTLLFMLSLFSFSQLQRLAAAPVLAEFVHFIQHPSQYAAAYAQSPEPVEQRDPWFQPHRASLMARFALFSNGLSMLASQPFGFGWGQFRTQYPFYSLTCVPDPFLNEIYREPFVHNWLLEIGLAIGIPGLILICLFLLHLWSIGPADFRFAALLQGIMGLAILNYLNPAIIFVLSSTCVPVPDAPFTNGTPSPTPPYALLSPLWAFVRGLKSKSTFYALGVFFGFVLFLVVTCHGMKGYLKHQWFHKRFDVTSAWLSPELVAEQLYIAGDFRGSWQHQTLAWKRDPYGPETILRIGAIAQALSAQDRTHSTQWQEISLAAYSTASQLFPYHRQAKSEFRHVLALWQNPIPVWVYSGHQSWTKLNQLILLNESKSMP